MSFARLRLPKTLFIFSVIIVFLSIIALSFSRPNGDVSETVLQEGFRYEDKNYTAYSVYVKKQGVDRAYELLKQHFPGNNPEAHDYAHVIGIVAHELLEMEGLAICDTGFNYGCYHGFIESFILTNGPEKVPVIENACIVLGSVHSPSCLHGIGHGVMANRAYKLPEALADCDLLKPESRTFCFDGVFMERNVPSMLGNKSQFLLTSQTLREPCDSVDSRYKKQCWRNQVFAWFQFFGTNTKKIGEQCSLVEDEFQQTCFESIGLQGAMSFVGIDGLLAFCQIVPDGSISDYCVMGEMKELLFEGKSIDVAKSLCGYVSSENSSFCQATFAQHFQQYQQRFGR